MDSTAQYGSLQLYLQSYEKEYENILLIQYINFCLNLALNNK